ncbi:hypothetical protein Nepgr_010916 [Nepenthes gracilis]|uniref:Uncharacterized protein n=1 Tax=Nepenthes gracilis TaxID=150966 RepID=A0AAD3XLV7_NEPGR|nr:hypothetical protein Nepgr_010916 [Nepenthes gracilis]
MESYRCGEPSSSSSLSALAPPFAVDKPFSKPNSNPPLNFTELPYAAFLDPSVPIWQQHPLSPNSGPNFLESEQLATSCLPSAGIYGYVDSQLNGSGGTHFVPWNLAPDVAFEPFSYDKYSSGMPNTFAEANSCHTSWRGDRNECGLVGHNDPGYDLLSISGVDCPESMPHLENTPPWGGCWNGMNNEEQLGGTSSSRGRNPSGSSACKSYTKQVEGSTSDSYIRQYLLESPGIEARKSFFKPSRRTTSSECSRTTSLPCTSLYKGIPHLEEPVLESTTNFCGSQNPYSNSTEEYASHSNSYSFGCTSAAKSTPVTVVKSPSSGFSLPAKSPPTSIKLTSTSSNAIYKNEDFAIYDPFYQELPHLLLDVNPQVGDITGIVNSFMSGPLSTKNVDYIDSKPDEKDAFDHLLVGKSAPVARCLSNFGGFNINLNIPEAICPIEKSSDGPDTHNHAVDSPCWKRAPASPFSPIEVSHALKILEGRNKLDNQGPYCPPLNTTDAIHVVSEKLNEKTSLGRPLVTENMPPEQDSGFTKQRFCCLKPNNGDELQLVDDDNQPGIKISLPNISETDSDSEVSFIGQPIPKEGEFARERKVAPPEVAAAGMTGKCNGITSTDGFPNFLSNAKDDLLNSSSGNNTTLADGKLQGKDSNVIIDLNMLVNMMKNLSEVLRYCCSNNPAVVREQDHAAIKHTISNLQTCILLEDGQIGPAEKVLLPQEGTSPLHEKIHDPLSSARLDGARERNVSALHKGQLNYKNLLEDKGRCVLGVQSDGFLDSSYVKNQANTGGNDILTQAVKKVLHENFLIKEESDCPALLYKNLWLEAEAALCAFTIKTRFQRNKIELDKHAQDKIEVSEDVQRSMGLPNTNRIAEVEPQAKDPVALGMCDHKSLKLRTTTDSENVEASVTDRFHSDFRGLSPTDLQADTEDRIQEFLESTMDNSHSMNDEGLQQLTGKERSGPHEDPPVPSNAVQFSCFSSTGGHADDIEASVMARIHILECRSDSSSSVNMNPQQLPQGQVTVATSSCIFDDEIQGLDFSPFAGYLNLSGHENVENFNVFVPGLKDSTTRDFAQSFETDRLGCGVLEGWYDCPESDWEHVSKDDYLRQK